MAGLNGYLDSQWRMGALQVGGRSGGGGTTREERPALRMDVPQGQPRGVRSRTPSI